MEHLVELRRMIEPAAARLAATRRSADQLQALAAALADMTAAVDDPLAYYRADLAFHRALFAASGNPFVDRLGAIVSAVLEVSFRLQRRSLIPMAVGLAMHGRVLDAIRARDCRCCRARHGRDHRGGAHRARARHRSTVMKITKLETIRLLEFPNILWVRVHGEDGLYGLGETFMAAASVEAFLHEIVAPRILGADAHAIDLIASRLYGYLGFRSSGVETRAASAVDIALWDLWGKATSQPIVQLLGGRTRERIRTYNTCAGYQYIRDTRLQQVENWGLGNNAGPYEDLEGFLHRADEVALSLLEQGITGMKIWPFDPAAEASAATTSPAPTSTGRWSRSARSAMRSATRWTSWSSSTRCGTCRPRSASPAPSSRSTRSGTRTRSRWTRWPTSATYAAASRAPVCASETLAFRQSFRELLEARAAGIVMLDLSWCGGLSEAKKIADHGRGLPSAGGPARLHRTGGAGRLDPPLLQRAQRADSGIGARVLHRLVQGTGHRPARGEGRHDRPAARAGPGADLLPDITSRKDAVVRLSQAD